MILFRYSQTPFPQGFPVTGRPCRMTGFLATPRFGGWTTTRQRMLSLPVRPGVVSDTRFRRNIPVPVVNSVCEKSHHFVESCTGTRNAHAGGPWPTCRPREPIRPFRRRKTTPSRHTSCGLLQRSHGDCACPRHRRTARGASRQRGSAACRLRSERRCGLLRLRRGFHRGQLQQPIVCYSWNNLTDHTELGCGIRRRKPHARVVT